MYVNFFCYQRLIDLPSIHYSSGPQPLIFFCLTGRRLFGNVVNSWFRYRSLAPILSILSNRLGDHSFPEHLGPLSRRDRWCTLVLYGIFSYRSFVLVWVMEHFNKNDLKGTLARDFRRFVFFHQKQAPGPLNRTQNYFRI